MGSEEPDKNLSVERVEEPALTLSDLLNAEAEVLRRVAQNYGSERSMAGHNSMTTGHNMSGSHTSHTMAKIERPFED